MKQNQTTRKNTTTQPHPRMKKITHTHLKQIQTAQQTLETESLAMRLSSKASKPLNALANELPEKIRTKVNKAVNVSLDHATRWATATTWKTQPSILREDRTHQGAVMLSGLLGGFFGITTTLIELPISTLIMLRSIACIAAREGFSPTDPAIRLKCMTVLAMGSDPNGTKVSQTSYWEIRESLALLVTQAAKWSGKGATPIITRFLIKVGEKFGIAVSAKVANQFVPVIGGLSGAAINTCFLNHYQKTAQAFFTMEKLINLYGEAPVKKAYQSNHTLYLKKT